MAIVTGLADPFGVEKYVRKYAPELVDYCVGYEIRAKPFGQPIELMLTLAVDPSVFEALNAE